MLPLKSNSATLLNILQTSNVPDTPGQYVGDSSFLTELYSRSVASTSDTSTATTSSSSTEQSPASNGLYYSSESVSQTIEGYGTTTPSAVSHLAITQSSSSTLNASESSSVNTATASGTSTPTPTVSSSAGLSTEARVGVGVGIGMSALLLAVASFLVLKTRQMRKQAAPKLFSLRIKRGREAAVGKSRSDHHEDKREASESNRLEAPSMAELSSDSGRHELDGKNHSTPELDGGGCN